MDLGGTSVNNLSELRRSRALRARDRINAQEPLGLTGFAKLTKKDAVSLRLRKETAAAWPLFPC